MNYILDDNPNKQKIEAYEEAMERITKEFNEFALNEEKKFLNRKKNIKKYIVLIVDNSLGEYCWYADEIGNMYEVYDYNRKQYILTGENFGLCIQKKDAEIIEIK